MMQPARSGISRAAILSLTYRLNRCPILSSTSIREDTLRRENKDLPKESAIEEAQPHGEELTTKTPPKNEANQQELIQAVPEIMRTAMQFLFLSEFYLTGKLRVSFQVISPQRRTLTASLLR